MRSSGGVDVHARPSYRRHVGYRVYTCLLTLLTLALAWAAPRPACAADYSAAYAPGAVPPVSAGQTFTVQLRVTNTGTLTWIQSGRCAAVLGYHWYQRQTRVTFDAQGTPLPASVAPGQSIELTATVVAPDVPGTYTLAWDMRAQCEWFTKMGAASGNQAVEVLPAR
jgi:hypothetical protein